MISVRDLDWMAGFFEGEGCFYSYRGGRSIGVSVAQVDREPLERIRRLLGGHIGLSGRKLEGNEQRCYHWQITGKLAAGAMMTVMGLMSARRREKIRAVLSGWMSVPLDFRDRSRCPQGHPYTGKHPKGGRYCGICFRRNSRAYRERQRKLAHDLSAMNDLFPGR